MVRGCLPCAFLHFDPALQVMDRHTRSQYLRKDFCSFRRIKVVRAVKGDMRDLGRVLFAKHRLQFTKANREPLHPLFMLAARWRFHLGRCYLARSAAATNRRANSTPCVGLAGGGRDWPPGLCGQEARKRRTATRRR